VEKNNEEIEQKVETLKREIQTISSKLKDLGGQKEEQYKQKNSLDKQLNTLISKAKDLKDKKQEVDKQIISLKKEREESNKGYNDILFSIRKTQREKRDRQREERVTPSSRLRKQIKDLEYNMQTEVLSFKKEKQIMDQIKKVKVELKKSIEYEESLKNSNVNYKSAKDIKKKADSMHADIQKLASESSQIFEELTKLSKDISDIKAQRNTVQLVLKNLKTQISQMNQKLSKILKDWSGLADKIFVKTARKGFEAIHKKTEEVKEKLKSKKKLTTDDILLLQREAMGR
jgi:uncharacterized coiled-coil DUF342 family protein